METDFDQLMRFDAEIARAERYSPEQMMHYGRARLAAISDFARHNTAYYRKRLAPLFAKGEFDPSRWAEVPVLSRELARDRYQELRAVRVPPYAGDTEENHTSGSTGTPLRFLVSGAEQVASQAFSKRAYVWWGMDGTKNFGGIHAFVGEDHQHLAEEGNQGWRYDAVVGRNYGCPLHWSVDYMLDWIPRQNIRYLSTRPSNLEVLAEAAIARGIGRSLRLEALLTVGGPLLPRVRELCLEAFGLPVRDTYGSLECGNIAVDCPQCGVLHINEEGKLVEILREDGTPCVAGETGRVLITPYFSYAMPLVRYDTGDYAELAEAPNPCGRPHRSLRRVLGRHTEAFMRRDGSRFFPSTQAKLFEHFMAFEQIQIVQTDFDAVELRYVPKAGQDRLDREAVQRYIREELGRDFVATLVPVPEIPRRPGAKFLYHICEVPQAAARLAAQGR